MVETTDEWPGDLSVISQGHRSSNRFPVMSFPTTDPFPPFTSHLSPMENCSWNGAERFLKARTIYPFGLKKPRWSILPRSLLQVPTGSIARAKVESTNSSLTRAGAALSQKGSAPAPFDRNLRNAKIIEQHRASRVPVSDSEAKSDFFPLPSYSSLS